MVPIRCIDCQLWDALVYHAPDASSVTTLARRAYPEPTPWAVFVLVRNNRIAAHFARPRQVACVAALESDLAMPAPLGVDATCLTMTHKPPRRLVTTVAARDPPALFARDSSTTVDADP